MVKKVDVIGAPLTEWCLWTHHFFIPWQILHASFYTNAASSEFVFGYIIETTVRSSSCPPKHTHTYLSPSLTLTSKKHLKPNIQTHPPGHLGKSSSLSERRFGRERIHSSS